MDIAIEAAVLAAKTLFSAYGGYSTKSAIEDDQSFRNEIERRLKTIKRHVENIQTTTHEEKMRDARDISESLLSIIDQSIDDTKMSISKQALHSINSNLNRKAKKKLVEHDLETLERLVKVTNQVNEVQELIFDSDEGEVKKNLRSLKQNLTGARNHFSHRNVILE